jgi:hypothetical protein
MISFRIRQPGHADYSVRRLCVDTDGVIEGAYCALIPDLVIV